MTHRIFRGLLDCLIDRGHENIFLRGSGLLLGHALKETHIAERFLALSLRLVRWRGTLAH